MKKEGVSGRILAMIGTNEEWVSSARMVKDLGISRMAVCKQIGRLRKLGYDIEASPRRGYRLTTRTQLAVPEEVVSLLSTRVVGRPYMYFAEIDSTNTFLRSRIAGLPEGATVVAGSQSRGRGRFQRDWFSPPAGNVYLSVLLKPAVSPLLAPQLSLVAASAVLGAIHAEGCEDAQVKWPNDIMWRGKKLAGILCEMEAEADVIHAVIVGIGVNANATEFPEILRPTAASLSEAVGRPVPVPALTSRILNNMDGEYAKWSRDGLTGIAAFLNLHSMLTGREVAIALCRDRIRGRVDSITDAGMLRVIQADGSVRDISSGEVRLCRPGAGLEKDAGP
jgi:BirA family biotin operon repressor/biotin-[acetyl-CoA-carboxylase] ligase